MNDVYYELEPRLERSTKQRAKSTAKSYRWVSISIIALLWIGLGAGAFALANYYIDGIKTQLEQIQQTNLAAITEMDKKLIALQGALQESKEQAELLKQQFDVVANELNAVKEEMSLAGDSLDKTTDTKQALSDRITDLSKELEELRKSINKLEEAALVY